MSKRTWALVGFTALCLAVAFLWPAVPQWQSYHDFADRRAILGVPNFFDVVSNACFAIAGIVGFVALARHRARFEHAAEYLPYAIFFAGLVLIAAGSGYYHLAPDNERLFWDRLAMSVAFMSLVAGQISDRFGVKAGLALLAPLLVAGAASVQYWIASERAGTGNVVPYGVLQFYAVVVLLVIAWSRPSRYTRGGDIYWVVAAYVAAKVLEELDAAIFALGNVVSGHTLKHVVGGVAGLFVCRMLVLRRLRAPAAAPESAVPAARPI
jgi:hypothetical protein